MHAKIIRDMLIMTTAVIGGAIALTHREAIYEFIGWHPSQLVQQKANNNQIDTTTVAKNAKQPQAKIEDYRIATAIDGFTTSVRKSPDGQFWAQAIVNKSSVNFLIDTGASIVALTPRDAMMAGINMKDLKYTARVNTAAGEIKAAPVQLDLVSVGSVTVRNVKAVIIPKGLSHSLLGMSYLGELQSVEARKNLLILRR